MDVSRSRMVNPATLCFIINTFVLSPLVIKSQIPYENGLMMFHRCVGQIHTRTEQCVIMPSISPILCCIIQIHFG